MQAIDVPLPVASIRPCPIGAIVAAHWIAHGTGPCPDFADVSDTVRYGLATLGDGWGVTAWRERLRVRIALAGRRPAS
jgi:hypothetical protein